MLVYIAVWSGGYEAPGMAAFPTEQAAIDQAERWAEDANPDNGDMIFVIPLNPQDCAFLPATTILS